MKLIIPLAMLIGGLLTSTLAAADCSSNRNVDMTISKPDGIYIDHGDGTVTDNITGLMWQKCSLGLSGNDCAGGAAKSYSWQDALKAAQNSKESKYRDWRLPNRIELESLEETACDFPAINDTIFPQTPPNFYWSSSRHAKLNNYAWSVYFDNGYAYKYMQLGGNYVRLVRNSEPSVQ